MLIGWAGVGLPCPLPMQGASPLEIIFAKKEGIHIRQGWEKKGSGPEVQPVTPLLPDDQDNSHSEDYYPREQHWICDHQVDDPQDYA